MWKRSRIMQVAERGCCGAIENASLGGHYANDGVVDEEAGYGDRGRPSTPRASISGGGGTGNYSFQPYAFPRASLSDWERTQCKATIEDYRRHFNLKIGVYVQGEQISATRGNMKIFSDDAHIRAASFS